MQQCHQNRWTNDHLIRNMTLGVELHATWQLSDGINMKVALKKTSFTIETIGDNEKIGTIRPACSAWTCVPHFLWHSQF